MRTPKGVAGRLSTGEATECLLAAIAATVLDGDGVMGQAFVATGRQCAAAVIPFATALTSRTWVSLLMITSALNGLVRPQRHS